MNYRLTLQSQAGKATEEPLGPSIVTGIPQKTDGSHEEIGMPHSSFSVPMLRGLRWMLMKRFILVAPYRLANWD
jgi:hypothetical protein